MAIADTRVASIARISLSRVSDIVACALARRLSQSSIAAQCRSALDVMSVAEAGGPP
jgi:hypothetical protein